MFKRSKKAKSVIQQLIAANAQVVMFPGVPNTGVVLVSPRRKGWWTTPSSNDLYAVED